MKLDDDWMRELGRTARDAADAAAAVHLAHSGRFTVESALEKEASDFVSEVDVEAQSAALAIIRERHPDHRILAEEEGVGQGVLPLDFEGQHRRTEERREAGVAAAPAGGDASDRSGGAPGPGAAPRPVWIVDPLDGTTNYLHGHPMYCASVGVAVAGVPRVGAVTAPATGQRWWAHRGGGAWTSGPEPFAAGQRAGDPVEGAKGGRRGAPRAISVSPLRDFRKALIGTGFPFRNVDLLPAYLVQFDRVMRATSGIRRGGSAALDLCYVADGTFDAFWELSLAPWDVAAGAAIVAEAGGLLTRVGGAALDVEGAGSILAANSPELMHAMTALLAERDESP